MACCGAISAPARPIERIATDPGCDCLRRRFAPDGVVTINTGTRLDVNTGLRRSMLAARADDYVERRSFLRQCFSQLAR